MPNSEKGGSKKVIYYSIAFRGYTDHPHCHLIWKYDMVYQ
jgi:hypothetical protein